MNPDILVLGGTWHDWHTFAAYIRPMLNNPEVRLIGNLGELPAAGRLVVFTCNQDRHMTPELARTYDRIADWVAAGGHLVALHSTLCVGVWQPRVADMMGARFKWHPPQLEIKFTAAEGSGLEPGEWSCVDEFYHLEENPADPILAWHDDGTGPRPIAWRRTYGLGRVSVYTPGHGMHVWSQPGYTAWLQAMLA